MKILVVCQYYAPEPFRITDICEELVRRGNDVTVVTGVPNYPMGEVYKGYEAGKQRDEVKSGVKIHRCCTVPRKTGAIRRMLNYYSYSWSSRRYVNRLPDDFDVVFINQLSPVMMAKAGINYAVRNKKSSVLYCLDLWPESLSAGGVKRDSFLYRWFHGVSKRIYQAADTILVSSCSFAAYFSDEFGITKTYYLPQYAEDLFHPNECLKPADGLIDLMFAGNTGAAQSVETIIRTAAQCRDIKKLRWHIVGDGIELKNLKKLAAELEAPVVFHGRKPTEEMPRYFAKADAMLVTMQKDDILSQTLPGKVQSYMAAGKPILGAIDGETQKVVNDAQCGFVTGACDCEQFSRVVREFAALSEEDRALLGRNARRYYEQNFSKAAFMIALETILRKHSACNIER